MSERAEGRCELVPEGEGWRFAAKPSGISLPRNVEVGYVLLHEPWESCWLVGVKETWSISAGGDHTRRMGIPHDWAMEALEVAGVDYAVKGGKYVPLLEAAGVER